MQLLNPRILVVDDSSFLRKLLVKLLLSFSCQVKVAATGLQALEILQLFDLDLVLLDQHLPDMTGTQVASLVRNPSNGCRNAWVPIVCISSYSGADLDEQCLSVGINEILPKPFRIQSLMECVSKYVVTRQRRSLC